MLGGATRWELRLPARYHDKAPIILAICFLATYTSAIFLLALAPQPIALPAAFIVRLA